MIYLSYGFFICWECSMKKYVVSVFYDNGSKDEFFINAESAFSAVQEFESELEYLKSIANVVNVEYVEEGANV